MIFISKYSGNIEILFENETSFIKYRIPITNIDEIRIIKYEKDL